MMQNTLSLPYPQPIGLYPPKATIMRKLAAALFFFFLLFWYGGPLLRLADPAAAVVDTGVLSLLLLSLLAGLLLVSVSVGLLTLLWPVLGIYRKYYFANDFKRLQSWQKLLFYGAYFFLLLFALVYCFRALM